jgi:2-C-methyl-D-erythritol 4-phosphate cytidylyltransferase
MNVALVVAGGKGTRFGSDRPKQFLELDDIPLIIHTLRQFERSQAIAEVIVVLPVAETGNFQSLIAEFELRKISGIVAGGHSRAQSVKNGLAAISGAEIVAVHDGVRPLVTPAEIDSVVEAARDSGAAILVAPLADTVKQVEQDRITGTLPRANLRRALTPQCFKFEILKRAYDGLDEVEAAGIDVTDDSFLVERLGITIRTVEGSAQNIKITTPADLIVARAILATQE